MASRNKRKASKVVPPKPPKVKPNVQSFSKGINMRIDPGTGRAMASEAKLREVIDMFRYHHPGVRIEVSTHTPGDYVEFYIEGVQRIKVAMTQMATMPPRDIYYILEKGVKYKDPYQNQLNNLQSQYQQGFANAIGGGYSQILKPRQMGKSSATFEEMKRLVEEMKPNPNWEEARNIFMDEFGNPEPKKKETNPTDDWAEKWAKQHAN